MLLFQISDAQNLSELGDIADQKQKQIKTDVVLMVANKDTIIYTKDSKLFSGQRGQAPIAASSEWLTAALIMEMVDEGKITLDDKISRYIPIFFKICKKLYHRPSLPFSFYGDTIRNWWNKKITG